MYGGAAASFTTSTSGLANEPSPFRAALSQGPLASVDENSMVPEVGIHPSSYLSARWCDEQSYLASAGTYLPPDEARSNVVPSAPPSMVSGRSAFESAQPLTRQNSAYGGSSGANMMRPPSSHSCHTEELSAQGPNKPIEEDAHCAKSSVPNPDLLAIGSSFAPAHRYPPSTSNTAVFLSPYASLSMQRSVSNTSSTSARSLGSNSERRLRETLTKQLENGKVTKLRPKLDGTSDCLATKKTSTHGRGGKFPPQKAPYRRPKGPKVFCTKCDEHPEGFRGDHELRRHLNAKHKGVVKKYVCRDPATVGLVSTVIAIQPLSECKSCSNGKRYGAYYNAADHLRRIHFKPKATRGKNKKPSDEKRGGKGGGDWPSMSELKLWFEEVLIGCDDDEEPVSSSISVVDDGANALSVDKIDWIFKQGVDRDARDNDVDYDYDISFQDAAQAHLASALVAGDGAASDEVAHVNDTSYDTMPHVSHPIYAISASVDGDVSFDPTFVPADFYSEVQNYPWPVNNI
ncbi:hypothetical protein EsDP_00005908 [Epichloe bromicola]|uniref:DUF7896 domain-containing protein n=1 Tax=Epichloe bromicola TaxID=79588 RepID=A0ABQ0CW27_9HYPO